MGEQRRVSVQTVKNGETYFLPQGSSDNPFPKKVRADHPRAEQVVGCWKYCTYFSNWMFIQAIKVDEAARKSFEVIFDDGRLTDIPVIESEGIFCEKFDTIGLRFDAIDRRIKEDSIR